MSKARRIRKISVLTSGGKFSVLTLSYVNTALDQSAFRIRKCYIIKAFQAFWYKYRHAWTFVHATNPDSNDFVRYCDPANCLWSQKMQIHAALDGSLRCKPYIHCSNVVSLGHSRKDPYLTKGEFSAIQGGGIS